MTTTKKAVRREIRDLTGDQWRRVVRAFWSMKKTSDIDGKKKYGPLYVSYDTLLKMHMSAALHPKGDQMHFGPQFGPTHRAWLLLFERSMQAIDPHIDGLPYWDFRRESIQTAFTSKYLGDILPPLSTNLMRSTTLSIPNFTLLPWYLPGSRVGSASEGYSVVDGAFAHWPVGINHSIINHTITPLLTPTRLNDISSTTLALARADTAGATVVSGAVTNAYGYHRHPLSINSRQLHLSQYTLSSGPPPLPQHPPLPLITIIPHY